MTGASPNSQSRFDILLPMPRDPRQRDSGSFNKFEKEFLRAIDEYGWHVMSVAPRIGEEGDLWSYSTGLFYRYKHPEIIIFNESTELRHAMIDAIGERARQGEKFEPGPGYADVVGGGYLIQFRPWT